MKSKLIVRSVAWLALGALAVSIPAASTSIEACGESGACSSLRSELYVQKATWDACDPTVPDQAHQCIFVPGNPKDCTGVLTCEFAVNPRFRQEAELAVYNVGEQSQGCYLCAVPDCIAASIPYCEPVSRRCIVVSGVSGNGTPIGSVEDSGANFPPSDDSGTASPDAAEQ